MRKNTTYCLEAAVLGLSLQRHFELSEGGITSSFGGGTRLPLLLLHTNDVPKAWLAVLRNVGWRLRCVAYIQATESLCEPGRFKHTFTKINALALTEYSTIVVLDTDLLIRKPVDSLFTRWTPSACRRHASGDFKDGQLMPPKLSTTSKASKSAASTVA